MEHLPLNECVKVHTELACNLDNQNKMLTTIRDDVRAIREKLEAQNDKIWALYLKVVVIGMASGGGVAGLLKLL